MSTDDLKLLARRGLRGVTLIELMIALGIISIVLFGAATYFRNQMDVIGFVSNNDYTVAPAQTALWRIRDELGSAVQAPSGVTNAVAPTYAVTAPDGSPLQFSSIVWRPVIGYISPADPDYATFNGQGRISVNNILYDNVAKKLWVDTSGTPYNVLKLDTVSGPTGSTLVRSEILAGSVSARQSVTEFRLYQGESTNAFFWNTGGSPVFAPGATNATYLLGIYLRVERPSVNPTDLGANTTSNWDAGARSVNDLRMGVLVQPETLSNTPGKPFVGP